MRTPFGHCCRIADETEITESRAAVPPPPAGAPPPPDARPPRFLLDDVWPWLLLLGVLAVAGLLLWLLVLNSSGDKGKVVPAVVGLPQQRAITKLTDDGFAVKAIVGPAGKPRGIVVSQVPGGGSRLDKGASVTIHVSNGRPLDVVTQTSSTTTAQTTTQSSQLEVPDVSGQDLASGAGQIEAAGFVAETDPVTAAGTPGAVVQQDPPAGTQAPAGSVVRLSVAVGSSRPPTQVPNVVGQKAAAARAALLDAKLTVKTVDKQGPPKSIGVVLAEAPTGTVPAYTQITLTVGR